MMTALEEIHIVADVPILVQIELDRKIMTIREILDLDVNGLIKLTKSAGENIDVLIGGHIFGYGEIVIIEDAVGVRITDFSSEE